MFYDMAALRKGGRFYLCYIASVWPSKFARVPSHQILDCNLLELSNELMEIITRESNVPSKKYSLRLSSTLLCGLTKIYQRQINIIYLQCLAFQKGLNKKEKTPKRTQVVLEEEPSSTEENREFITRNMAEITLKEDVQVPTIIINDNFGELPKVQENINAIRRISTSANREIARANVEKTQTMEMPENIEFPNNEQDEGALTPNIQDQISKNTNKRNITESTNSSVVPEQEAARKRKAVQVKLKFDQQDRCKISVPSISCDTLLKDFKPFEGDTVVNFCFENFSIPEPNEGARETCPDELKLLYLNRTALCSYPTVPERPEMETARPANYASPSRSNMIDLVAENPTPLPTLQITKESATSRLSPSKTIDNRECTPIPDLSNFAYPLNVPVETDASEEQLSLDRTPVSLGDEDPEKEKIDKLLSDNWGPPGLNEKIRKAELEGEKNVNLEKIVNLSYEPESNITRRMATVRAFASLLTLKKNNIVEVVKKENSCEIQHISLKKHSQEE